MLAVPVNALVDPHVEADQDHASDTKVENQVQRLEAAIAAPADLAAELELIDQTQPDPLDVRIVQPVLGDLQSAEFGDSVAVLPPSGVASVEGVGPGAESPAFVEGDEAGSIPAGCEVDGLGAGSRPDDDDGFTSPVGEPAKGSAPPFAAFAFTGGAANRPFFTRARRSALSSNGTVAPRR